MTAPAWATADAYLFDIDGTLLNVRDATHYFAFHNAVRNVFGVSSHIDGVPVHGNTDPGILRAVLRREGIPDDAIDARLPEIYRLMCDEVHANQADIRAELCPSVVQALDSLSSAGKLLGVVSGNLERIAWIKLERAGLRSYFQFGCFSDRAELREDIFRDGIREAQRRLHSQAKVCFVGDTPSDVKAAQKLGVPVIALATGIYDVSALAEHSPDACFSCCTDLIRSGVFAPSTTDRA
jgi:phosphoglycolate phosphatase-like HAD superfamily hydrolase